LLRRCLEGVGFLSPRGRSLLDTTAREVMEELVKVRPDLAKYL